jgi:putative transposase
LEIKTKSYQTTGHSPTAFDLSKQLTGWKQEVETAWLAEVSAQALQGSLHRLDDAFTNFFEKRAESPNFKSKFGRQSFTLPQYSRVDFSANRIHLQKFSKGIKAKLHRAFTGKIKSCTVKRTATGKYFVSVLVESEGAYPVIIQPNLEHTLGLDLGLTSFLTYSNGNKIANPRPLKQSLKRLRRAQQHLSRCKKGSNRRQVAKTRVARVHEQVSNIRKDFLHKLTHSLDENQDYTAFAIEDLGIGNMVRNKHLSRSISDASWGEFRRQLEYKSKERGKSVLVIGRFEPSSKLCSCGVINHTLPLSDRVWTCTACNTTHDRDVLAAQNIKRFALCEPRKQSVPPGRREITRRETLRKVGELRMCGNAA